ncbi:MAG: Crp/Fnr family transcriptional regulator [Myxococcota bacterium]|nr:Crp/Fnr family transcriptional regulator [Myxococcota bacterium]
MHAETNAELESAEVFRALSRERRARLAPLLRSCPFEARRVLYFEGEDAERLWIVKQGQVRLYKSSSRGQITTLDVLGPGEVFGALATIGQDTYPSSAEATTEGAAWWLPRSTFQQLIEEEPAAAMDVLRVVARRLRDAQAQLPVFAYERVPARLARALLRASPDGEADLTRRDLAELAGTTVETAIRVLRRFERDGLLRTVKGHIEIQDREELEHIASSEA